MTEPDCPASAPRAFITTEEVRRRRATGERLTVRYEPVPWRRGGTPSFIAVYTLEDGSERAFTVMRVRRQGVEPKLFSIWPGLWSHHVEFGDGEPFVVPITAPLDEEPEDPA